MSSGVLAGRGFAPTTTRLSGRPSDLHADDELVRRYRGMIERREMCVLFIWISFMIPCETPVDINLYWKTLSSMSCDFP